MASTSQYSEDSLVAYNSSVNQALEMNASTMADIGPKNQIQLAINGIQPSHFAALAKDRIIDSTDWVTYWQVSHALEEQFKQSEIITRAALVAASAQKKYAEEFKKLNSSMTVATIVAPSTAKVLTEKPAWIDRKKPKVLNAERPSIREEEKPYVDKPCANCGPRHGSRHVLTDCKQISRPAPILNT